MLQRLFTRKPVKQPSSQAGFVNFIGGLVSLVFGIIIGILAFRFIFRLLGANPGNGLVNWIYEASIPLVSPFFGIFNYTADLATGRLEFETLIAIIVYGVVAAIVTSIFSMGSHRHHTI